jgi:hypothetical protein
MFSPAKDAPGCPAVAATVARRCFFGGVSTFPGGEGEGVAPGFLRRPGGGVRPGKIPKFNRGAADE